MKCRGTELNINKKNSHLRLGWMFRMFFQLGIPMSSQTFFRCAALISLRVGATSNCMHRLDAPSSNVERILMPTWEPVPSILTLAQSPWYNLITPLCDVIPNFDPSTATMMTLTRSTVTELANAVHRSMCLFECQILQLRHPLAL